MMQNVRLEPNDIVLIQSRTLKAATFVKLQPQSVDFLDISNPRGTSLPLYFRLNPSLPLLVSIYSFKIGNMFECNLTEAFS